MRKPKTLLSVLIVILNIVLIQSLSILFFHEINRSLTISSHYISKNPSTDNYYFVIQSGSIEKTRIFEGALELFEEKQLILPTNAEIKILVGKRINAGDTVYKINDIDYCFNEDILVSHISYNNYQILLKYRPLDKDFIQFIGNKLYFYDYDIGTKVNICFGNKKITTKIVNKQVVDNQVVFKTENMNLLHLANIDFILEVIEEVKTNILFIDKKYLTNQVSQNRYILNICNIFIDREPSFYQKEIEGYFYNDFFIITSNNVSKHEKVYYAGN